MHPKSYSLEFFPPKSEEGMNKLMTTAATLQTLAPDYVSVTFGAGGSTQEGTVDTVRRLLAMGLAVAPHLSCIGASRDSLASMLTRYQEMGVKRIVALRGDMPSGMREAGEFAYASELVRFIRQTTGDHFHIEVAAYPEFHPQATSAEADLNHFCHKVAAGANGAITQYFYSLEAYLRFVDDCQRRGVTLPIIPGIMPITNYKQLARFSTACGAELPRWLRLRLEAMGDDLDAIRRYGEEVVTRLCQRLLDHGAPGLHFYSMNQVDPTRKLWHNLGLPTAAS
jgi:methylenetetrahydrofolate reductase (NADPH)